MSDSVLCWTHKFFLPYDKTCITQCQYNQISFQYEIEIDEKRLRRSEELEDSEKSEEVMAEISEKK